MDHFAWGTHIASRVANDEFWTVTEIDIYELVPIGRARHIGGQQVGSEVFRMQRVRRALIICLAQVGDVALQLSYFSAYLFAPVVRHALHQIRKSPGC